MKTKDEILTEILLNEAHLNYIRQEMYDIEDEESSFYNNEYDKTFNEIERLKKEYKLAPDKTFTGKITITFDEADDDMRWECYHLLNHLYQSSNGAVQYKTIYSEDSKYSKDFNE